LGRPNFGRPALAKKEEFSAGCVNRITVQQMVLASIRAAGCPTPGASFWYATVTVDQPSFACAIGLANSTTSLAGTRSGVERQLTVKDWGSVLYWGRIGVVLGRWQFKAAVWLRQGSEVLLNPASNLRRSRNARGWTRDSKAGRQARRGLATIVKQ
jgi:hypothetical protein